MFRSRVHARSFFSLAKLASLAVAAAFLAPGVRAADYTWNGGGTDDLWGTGGNWAGGAAPSPGSGNSLIFAGTTRLTPSNNYGDGDDFQDIIFDPTAGSFTLGRAGTQGIDWFGSITNNSANAQTIGFSFYQSAANTISAASGDITLNSSALVYRNGRNLTLDAASGKTIKLSGVIADGGGGAGSGIAVTGAGTVNFDAANTFTSGIGIDSGTVLATTSASALGTGTVWIGNGGNTYGNTSATLAIGTGGLAITNAITTNKADNGGSQGTGTRTIATTYSSGTTTLSGTININGGLVFDTASGGTLAVSSTIQDGSDTGVVSRALTKTGGGTLTLSGANTYSGGTTISSGTLLVSGTAGLPGTGAVAIGPGTTFEWNTASGNRTITAVNSFSGTGTFVKSGANQLILRGTNTSTFSGTVRVTGGLLILDTATGFEDGAPALNLSGGDIVLGDAFNNGTATFGDLSGSGKIRVDWGTSGSTRTVSINQTGNTTYSGEMGTTGSSTRTLSLVKNGTGTLTLTGANIHLGATTVNGGTLKVSGTMRNTSGMTVNTGATLELGATNMFTSSHGVAMDNARVLTADGGTLLMNGNMDSRIGNVTLTNGATWTSNRTLSAWDVLLANTSTGAATVTVSGSGASTMNGTGGIHLQGVQNFAVADVTGDAGADLTVSMVLASQGSAGGAAGGINKTGAGTMLLSGANTFTGNVTVNAGTIKIGNKNALGAFADGRPATQVTVASGAAVDFNGVAKATYGYTIAGTGVGGTGALTNSGQAIGTTSAQASNIKLSGDASIGGTGNWALLTNSWNPTSLDLGGHTLTKVGSNTIHLSNATATSGTIRISSGTLAIYDSGSKPSGLALAAVTLDNASGATLNLNNSSLPVGSLSGGGATGGNVSLGSGTLTVGALNTDTAYAGVISGTGALAKTGSGTLALTGANTYTGNTTINGGVLDLTSGNLYTGAGYNNTSVVTVNTGGTLKVNSIAYGATESLGLLSDYAARRVINGGTLEIVGATHSTGCDFTVGANGGTLRYNPTNTADTMGLTGATSDDIQLGGALTIDTIGNVTVSEVITGTGGSITKTGARTLTLSGINTYTGGTTVDGGTLRLTASSGGTGTIRGTLTANTGSTIEIGGADVLGYSTGSDAVRTINLNNATLVQTQDRNEIYAGVINMAAGSTISATGGANAKFDMFGGSAAINTTGDATNTISSPIRFRQDNTTITVADGAAGTDLQISGVISANGLNETYAGALTKAGAGTLALSAANTYPGNTTIKAGTLALSGSGSIASSPVITVGDAGSSGAVLDVSGLTSGAHTGDWTLGSSQTLKGIGTVTTADTGTIFIGGTHAPGNSIGLQTFKNVTYNPNSIFEWEMGYNGTTGRGTNYDAVNVTGNLNGNNLYFRIVLPTSGGFNDSFWSVSQTWTDIFQDGSGNNLSWTGIFSRGFQYYNTAGSITAPDASTQGYFTFDGASTLKWIAVPELSNLLVGGLLAVGLLRRRRVPAASDVG